MMAETGPCKLRELVVDLRAPRFRSRSTPLTPLIPSSGAVDSGSSQSQSQSQSPSYASLNDDQRMAVERVVQAEDYVCILGMPGTGKTTTIAHIVHHLTQLGKTVLLSSYTHSAVDNILVKMLRMGHKDLLRIGQPSKVHERIAAYTLQAQTVKNVRDFILRSISF